MKILLFLALICAGYVISEKLDTDILKNYSEFFNFGNKKVFSKLERHKYENTILKSKVDILGTVFKKNVDQLKSQGILDLIFLIDASSSVGEYNFKSELKFVKKLLSDVTVDLNHTRVAVVTFSSQNSIVTNVDEISIPTEINNKCLLLNKEINNIEYMGGGTYTLGAFKTAQEIFKKSRREAKKVLFLITDGFSNGGDPVPIANELKSDDVTIFTIGILNGNYKELYQLSTEPGELYSYLLDSFEEFESLARRALHVDLQSGDYISLGNNAPCNKLCNDTDCCDQQAFCTCGTSTGQYNCLCKPGYYGSGLKNSCSPCPSTSYASNGTCLPCPDIHHYTMPPAIGIKSCRCKAGYSATHNYGCEVIKCPQLSAPENGYFVKRKNCSNVLNSACGVRCNIGYTLTGSSIRLCQGNATWSGKEASCQIKNCTKLHPPVHGGMTCSLADVGENNTDALYLPVDTVCRFTCERGRTLVGSNQRSCLPLAQWDGIRTACKLIKCNKLSKINFGTVEPKSCTTGKQPFGKKCNITCNAGFKLVGPNTKICTGQHGTWDTQDDITCKDVIKPEISCPDDIKGVSTKGKPYGMVDWVTPNATDNSDLNVMIWSKPAIKINSKFKFKIGKTTVTYFAQDATMNKAKCSFVVEIEDKEDPTVEGCIDPPPFLVTNSSVSNITWDEPNIFDNSQNVQIIKSHDFGIFNFGTTQVTYTATDFANNTNICVLNITLQESKCESLQDPVFGHSECKPFSDSIQCVVTCEEGYALPLSAPSGSINVDDNTTNFICEHSEPIWHHEGGADVHPECTVTEIPMEINRTGVIIADGQDVCENTTAMSEFENDIKKILHDCVGFDCNVRTNATCIEQETEEDEESTNIINKREIRSSKKRGRRRRKKINIEFNLHAKKNNATGKASHFGNALTKLVNRKLQLEMFEATVVCPPGSFNRKFKCIRCPEGTFHNMTSNFCQSCPIGSYNDKMGEIVCLSCPEFYSTRKLHAKSSKDCKEQCPPGTYARKKKIKHAKNHPNAVIERTTLKPYCSSCPIGQYQNRYGQTFCEQCPQGFTTLTRRALDVSDCVKPCNNIGICNYGRCVPDDFHYSCVCNENYIGTHCETQIGACGSNPCQSNASCSETDDGAYKCACPIGYSGPNCGQIVEICDLPCKNGVCVITEEDGPICLCSEGYTGNLCDVLPKICASNLCENDGVCVDTPGGFYCSCIGGFIGKRCNYLPCDYHPCPENAICVNLEANSTTKNNFRCDCSPGFGGIDCADILDSCSKNPCQNNARCLSTTDGYKCECRKGYVGVYCETAMRSEYVLNFPRSSVTDFITMEGFKQNLTEITICVWLQTADSFNYGTVLSYATESHDNAFTITDYTGLVLYINNNYVVTDLLLNDGAWHHFCVLWQSSNGKYKLYLDAEVIQEGTGLSNNQSIAGGGKMVIGQEQDILGGKFSQSESFVGKMAYLDIYSKALDADEIKNIMSSCTQSYFGDIYAWPEFLEYTRGDVEIEQSTFCQNCRISKSLYNGNIVVKNNTMYYSCNEGFKISNSTYKGGRRCTKASTWEGTFEPYCKVVSCGHPGYVFNGIVVGNRYTYLDEVIYKCNFGYNLTGAERRVCDADGIWKPDKPKCLGVQCAKFELPEYATATVMMDDDLGVPYDDYLTVIEVGSQVEFTCKDNGTLDGESALTCQYNGIWDFEPPKCKPVRPKKIACSLDHIPEPPTNGFITEESLERVQNGTGDTIQYKCRGGFKLVGDNSSTCIIDGYWSELRTVCVIKTCDETPKYNNMYAITNGTSKLPTPIGRTLAFQCVQGYRSFGNMKIRCLLPGLWSRMHGGCMRISCGKPAVDARTTILGKSYLYKSKLILMCAGIRKELQCESNGMWIGDKDGC